MQDTLFSARIPVQSTDLPTTLKIHITLKSTTLELKLISTTNLFTFYLCTVSPGDFSVTKREQGIKVDFQTFIKTLINYFQGLIDNEMTAVAETIDDSKLRFVFMENNPFRNVTRLELVFYKPDENEFKKYLAEMISRFENDNVKLVKDLKMAREALNSVEKKMKEKIRFMESDYGELKGNYDSVYREKCYVEDEVVNKRKEIENLEKKIVEYEKRIAEHEYSRERMRMAEIKSQKEKNLLEELSEKVEKLEIELESKEKNGKRFKEEIRLLKNKESDYEDLRKTHKEEIERNKRERDERGKKIKKYESVFKEMKSDINKQNEEIEALKRENKDLQKKLENSQSVYNYLYNKKGEKGNMNDSEDSSLFSSVHPESPPRKEM